MSQKLLIYVFVSSVTFGKSLKQRQRWPPSRTSFSYIFGWSFFISLQTLAQVLLRPPFLGYGDENCHQLRRHDTSTRCMECLVEEGRSPSKSKRSSARFFRAKSVEALVKRQRRLRERRRKKMLFEDTPQLCSMSLSLVRIVLVVLLASATRGETEDS